MIVGILGLIFSILGLKKIKQNGEGGKGLAIAGLVISIVTLAIYLFAYILIIGMAACVSTIMY